MRHARRAAHPIALLTGPMLLSPPLALVAPAGVMLALPPHSHAAFGPTVPLTPIAGRTELHQAAAPCTEEQTRALHLPLEPADNAVALDGGEGRCSQQRRAAYERYRAGDEQQRCVRANDRAARPQPFDNRTWPRHWPGRRAAVVDTAHRAPRRATLSGQSPVSTGLSCAIHRPRAESDRRRQAPAERLGPRGARVLADGLGVLVEHADQARRAWARKPTRPSALRPSPVAKVSGYPTARSRSGSARSRGGGWLIRSRPAATRPGRPIRTR
jgi:hypothetical protein